MEIQKVNKIGLTSLALVLLMAVAFIFSACGAKDYKMAFTDTGVDGDKVYAVIQVENTSDKEMEFKCADFVIKIDNKDVKATGFIVVENETTAVKETIKLAGKKSDTLKVVFSATKEQIKDVMYDGEKLSTKAILTENK